MTSLMRVAAIPVGPAGRDPDASHPDDLWREVEVGVAEAAAADAGLAVLPELTVLPYVAGDDPARWRHLAEPADGPTARRMAALARHHGVALVFGLALSEPGETLPLNAALLAQSDGSVVPIAAKHRLPPPLPGDEFGEADHFRAGPATARAVRVAFPGGDSLRVAGLVCYDRRFPEAWDVAAGADLVAVLVAGPAPSDPPGFFATELAGHARRCRVAAVAAARHGTEHGIGRPVQHDGDSFIVGPDGRLLAAWRPEAPGPVLAALSMPDRLRLSLPTA